MSYITEELVKKWQPVLEHGDLDPIKDPHKRQVVATLLENQENAAREAATGSGGYSMPSLLGEAAPANAMGASSSTASDGAIDIFDPVLISLVRRSMPNLIAYDICGVQPMTGPTGLIFAMRARYASQTGDEALYNEANTSFAVDKATDLDADTLGAGHEGTGPVVQTALINWIKKNYSKTNYSYRFVFLPETIGSISYLSKKLKILQKNVIAGFNLTCLGDRGAYTLIKSKNENTLSDKALKACLFKKKNFREYSFVKNGSDERQYCSPGVDLPVATFCRSKFGDYKEYHTSLDNLKFVSEKGLEESLQTLITIIICFEEFLYPKTKLICEPFLSKYGLYKSMTSKYDYKNIQDILNAINYADGKRTIFDISLLIKVELNDLIKIYRELKFKKIIY